MSTYSHAPLGEMCEVNPRARRTGYPGDMVVSFVPMAAVDGRLGAITVREERPFAEVSKGFTSFEEGDVLFAKITPCMENGKAALARNLTNGVGRGSTEFYVLRPNDRVLGEYIYHFVRQTRFREEAKRSFTGTVGQQRVPKSFMENASVPLPPLAEQRRIVGVLNRAARIERLRAQAADRLHAFAPALFVKMFGDPEENPKGWPIVRLRDVATVLAGDPAPQEPGAFAARGPLFVRMQDVGRGHVNPTLSVSKDHIDPDWLSENRLRLFPKGSILIPKSGASVNLNHRAMLATEAHVVSHLAVLIPNRSRIFPGYLFWWSVHYDPRKKAQTTSLPSLKIATLKEADIPIPPLNKQRNFMRFLNWIDRMNHSTKKASKYASNLTESLMGHLLGDST